MKEDISLCIETVSGKLVNPSKPDKESIDISDIAWALSRMPRFAGHTVTAKPYTVAQHSVYVSELVAEILEDTYAYNLNVHMEDNDDTISVILIKALLHDAHEAYTGDVPSPIKRIAAFSDTFKLIESNLDAAIFEKFNLTKVTDDQRTIIKYADKLAQAIESYQFMPSRGLNWNLPKPSLIMLQSFPTPLSPLDAYKEFLNRFNYLEGQ